MQKHLVVAIAVAALAVGVAYLAPPTNQIVPDQEQHQAMTGPSPSLMKTVYYPQQLEAKVFRLSFPLTTHTGGRIKKGSHTEPLSSHVAQRFTSEAPQFA